MSMEVEGHWSDQSDNVVPWTENENLDAHAQLSAHTVLIVWVSLV